LPFEKTNRLEKHRVKKGVKKCLYYQMRKQYDDSQKKLMVNQRQTFKAMHERITDDGAKEHVNAIAMVGKERQEKYNNLLQKFPNLQLSPEKFKAKMEFERIHRFKSQYFDRKEKVDLVNQKAKVKYSSFAKEEFNPTLPKTPDYQKKRIIMSIDLKIEANTPKVKHYLHEGALAKKPKVIKSSSVTDIQMKPQPRQTIFTDIISEANSRVKTQVLQNYYPEIAKKRGVDRRSSWKEIIKRKNMPTEEKYRQIMLQAQK
jgi:hypothetical protein